MKKMKRLLFLAGTLLLLAQPALADLAEGIKSFERGDYETSHKVLQPLAESGDPRAQYLLGILYLNGFVEAPAQDAALSWLTKAAMQGDVQAQSELARMYRMGDGVEQDFVEMARWYQEAAETGDVGAQLLLADTYAYGHGVAQDLVKAYMWYEIAIQYWGHLAVGARDVVAEGMTADQIARATALANEWLKERAP